MTDSPHAPTVGGMHLRRTLAAWLSLMIVVSCAAVGTVAYYLRTQGIEELMFHHLEVVRDDRAAAIDRWFEERRGDLTMWSQSPWLVEVCRKSRQASGVELELYESLLETMRKAYHCHSVAIIAPKTDQSILTTESKNEIQHVLSAADRERIITERQTLISDVFICPVHHQPALMMSAPITGPGGQTDVVGILVFFADMENWFYPELLTMTSLGKTGELLLVNSQGVAQSPLRYRKDAEAHTVITAEPARRAAAGETGTTKGLDYRGVAVMAAYGPIPQMHWGLVVKQDRDEIMGPTWQMTRHILGVTLAAVIVAVGIALVLAGRIAACLAAEKTNDLAQQLRVNNEELTRANEELQSQSEELQQQAEELRRQTEELEMQRQAVEAADRLKSQFLSNMSHELRTPLNSVMALSQLMISRGAGARTEQDLQYLQIIERNGRHLLSLINDILDLSKIESGRMDLSIHEFSPADAVHRVVDTSRPLAEQKKLALNVRIDETPAMRADDEKLHQILLNLLSNAIKFTDTGSVDIEVRAADGRILFIVRDTGIGIAPHEVAHIFDEFRQVDGTTTRLHEGTGLGLAIAQRLAGLLGGRITVETELGKGSTFRLDLPVECPRSARVLPAVARDSRLSQAGLQPRRTILVIDDDPRVCDLLKTYLAEGGYNVETACSGEEGLRLARELQPRLILMDMQLPLLSGMDAVRQIKADSALAHAPIIALTSSAMKGDREKILAAGCDDYMSKPIDAVALTRLVLHWLDGSSNPPEARP